MLTAKRSGDDLTRSISEEEQTTSNDGGEMLPYYLTNSNKRQKTCEGGGDAIKSLPSGTSFGDSSSSAHEVSERFSEEAVSKMSRSAVSLFLFEGGIVNVLTCSGVVVERKTSFMRVMTSAKLATTSKDTTKAGCRVMAGDGAPLFDGDGNFVGMNLLLDTGRRFYVQMSVIIEQLEQFEKINKLRVSETVNRFRYIIVYRREDNDRRRNGKHYSKNPKAIELTAQDPLEDVDSLGYPKKPETAMEGDMVLVNTFEEAFGDSFDSGEGVWCILSKTVAENLSRSVVSPASYDGSTRFFACSGVIIEWKGCSTILTSASLFRNRFDEKKIEENLKIDVLLPNKQHTEGTLEHYNLHYNVAIVSFKGFSNHFTVNIHDRGARRSSKVLAVGRCFQSSMLMAAAGICTGWQSRFDCDGIQYSTCEITKAGIGGPVVDFEGKIVGMNFYDWKEGTPFLPQAMIVLILAHFEKKRIVDVVAKYGYTNRWPVPKPLWRRSNEHHPEN